MSFLSDSVPAVNPALEPADIRKGGPAAQRAYQVGLAFEQMLVDQLSQELTASTGGSADGTDATSSGLMGSDPASSTYAQMLPQALSSGVMSGGGLGVAAQIAGALDPSIRGTR